MSAVDERGLQVQNEFYDLSIDRDVEAFKDVQRRLVINQIAQRIFVELSSWYGQNHTQELNIEDVVIDIDYRVIQEDNPHKILLNKIIVSIGNEIKDQIFFQRDERGSLISDLYAKNEIDQKKGPFEDLINEIELSQVVAISDVKIQRTRNEIEKYCIFGYAKKEESLEKVLRLESLSIDQLKELFNSLSKKEKNEVYQKMDDRWISSFRQSSKEYSSKKIEPIRNKSLEMVKFKETLLNLESIRFIRWLNLNLESKENLRPLIEKLSSLKMFNMTLNLEELSLADLKTYIEMLPDEDKNELYKHIDDRRFYLIGEETPIYAQQKIAEFRENDKNKLLISLKKVRSISIIRDFHQICQKRGRFIYSYFMKMKEPSFNSALSTTFQMALRKYSSDDIFKAFNIFFKRFF